MGKASDKKKSDDDNNDSLVMALESIKTLLASGGKKRAETAEDAEVPCRRSWDEGRRLDVRSERSPVRKERAIGADCIRDERPQDLC